MTSVRAAAAASLTVLSLLIGSGVAGGQTRIGPDEHFLGLVNGSNDDPVVYTICPGPAWPGRVGPVAGGQTMSVAEVADGGGFTGPFDRVFAWFDPSTAAGAPTQLRFRYFGIPKPVPTSIRVPCEGAGTVTFSSCPFGAPCAAGWVPDHVAVQFVNIAA
jgi:hypothetical protein